MEDDKLQAQLNQRMGNMMRAFDEAARAETGAAKPLFSKLRNDFHAYGTELAAIDAAGATPDALAMMEPASPNARAFLQGIRDVAGAAQDNVAAHQALGRLMNTLLAEATGVIETAKPVIKFN